MTEKLLDNVLAAAPVLEYLDLKALAISSATNSSIRAKVGAETMRRRHRLQEIKTECRDILLSNTTGTCIRQKAAKLKDEALRWTCYECSMTCNQHSGDSIKEGHPFAEECGWLEPQKVADFDQVLMLPDLYYGPSSYSIGSNDGGAADQKQQHTDVSEITVVNEEEIVEMEQIVLDMWPWEDREQELYVAQQCGFVTVEPLHPTTVFYASAPLTAGDMEVALNLVDFYKVVMANQLPRDVMEANREEAFRIAARRFILGKSAAKDTFPLAVPFFLYALEMME